MAVSIDTVYQRVLAIANKEQRGYITPQEFNLFANQAQMDIFEQYFYDNNAFLRAPGNDTTYSDVIDMLGEKIDHFEKYRQNVAMSTSVAGEGTLPDYYRIGELYTNKCGEFVEIEIINQNEIHHILKSPLTAPTTSRPVYVRNSGGTATERERRIQIYPTTIDHNATVVCNYIARPQTVEWGYTVVNDKALYNSSSSQDFELHESEETELVIKILALSGVQMKDPNLYSIASQEDAKSEQQEKQ